MLYKSKKLLEFTLIFLGLSLSNLAFSGVHFTVEGSASNFNLGLQTQNKQTMSLSVAMDLGSYFRVGLTHKETADNQKGYTATSDENVYAYSDTTTSVDANSVDLTLILYYGEIFTPYIMTGIVRKTYTYKYATSMDTSATIKGAPMVTGNAAVGVGIKLNQNFSLKLSYTMSPGYTMDSPTGEVRSAWDRSTTVGVTYKI